MISIKNLKDETKASRFGSCVECGETSRNNTDGIFRVRFDGVSVALCKHHLIQLRDTVVSFCNWENMT